MATWTFDDGTKLRSGGVVVGAGPAAQELRRRIADPATRVHVFPEPTAGLPLDVRFDLLLHRLAFEVAWAVDRSRPRTRYVPDDDDAPPALRERLAQYREHRDEAPFGTVY